MERHQRIQLKTTSRSTNQPFKVSPFQTSGFGVQQKTASTPASKAELWENYQRSNQIAQQGAGLTRSPIQAKLTIGQPGDKYEQEADSVADRVMAMSEPAQVQREELPAEEELQAKSLDHPIQREALPEEEEMQMKPVDNALQREALPEQEEEIQAKSLDHPLQREALPEEEEMQMKPVDNVLQREALPEEGEEIQAKQAPTPHTPVAAPSLENQLSSSKGGGNPLSDDVRSFMEPRFGADFSGVRVHTGSDAVQMNQSVNAQAFAHGKDVYFGAGKAPGKDSLTAHELTHVVQQTGASMRPKRNNLVNEQGNEGINRWSWKKAVKFVKQAARPIVKQVTTRARNIGSTIKKGAGTVASTVKKGFKFFGTTVKKGAGAVKQGAKAVFNKLRGMLGPVLELQKILVKVLSGAGSAIPGILKNPVAFVKSLFSGLGQGFKNFISQIQKHLQKGLQTFLFGSLGNLNLKLPQSFNVEGLLSLTTQLTGLSHDKIRAKAVGKLGEDKVSLIEQGASAAKTGNVAGFAKQQAVNQIPPEKQRQIQEASQMFQALRGGAKGMLKYFSSLNFGEISKLVIDGLKTYLIEQVMMKGITKIVASLTPGAGWILAAIDAMRMMYGLFIERAQQVKSLANGAVQSIVSAADRNTAGVAQKLESSLGSAVPMLISIIGDYVGVSDISKKVQQFLAKGSDWVNQNVMPVVDRILDKVAG